MKTKRIAYRIEEFVDYTGKIRKFVMAAVSIIPDEYCALIETREKGFSVTDEFSKILSIGVSVCRPNDEFDEKLGIEIAVGKATKNTDHRLYSNDEGLINNLMVNALLEQECKYFKSNPGRYLKGYDEDMEKFNKVQTQNNLKKSLLDKERAALDSIQLLNKAEFDKVLKCLNDI